MDVAILWTVEICDGQIWIVTARLSPLLVAGPCAVARHRSCLPGCCRCWRRRLRRCCLAVAVQDADLPLLAMLPESEKMEAAGGVVLGWSCCYRACDRRQHRRQLAGSPLSPAIAGF
ncbi:hypothetical protein ACLOJK_014887 [Asimina triloba]